jgi:class 3 adenylate cyclase/pimeloyl-ACP methyl ester carboxylesterase
MDQQVRFCTTSDGVQIAYAVTGRGYPLVWIPGWVSHAEIDWDWPILGERYQALTKDFTLYRLDKRGTGLSARKLPEYSRAKSMLDLEALVKHAGLDRFALAGYSEGGPVAVEYAAEHPEQVSHLVLMGTGALSAEEDQPVIDLIRALVTITRTSWGSAAKMMTDIFLGEEAHIDAQQRFAEYQRQSAFAEDAAAMLAAVPETFDIAGVAPQVRVPTLVMHARQDRAVPIAASQRLAALIPSASFKSIDGQHVPDHAQSLVMVDAIREFVLGDVPPPSETKELPATSAPLTILFTDITSSTSLTQQLGDAKAQELVRAHNAIVRDALNKHSGSEIKHTGDGIMASFFSPSAALDCAIAIQRAVAASGDAQLGVHIGINAGEPVAEDHDLFGTSVQLARRICDQASGSEILVSDVVRQLVAGKQFLFSDRGEVALRGFEDPARLYELRWQAEPA